jgi:hypothetical protein
LTAPCVPTGRKAGVLKDPWSVSTLPILAREKLSFLITSKRKAIIITNGILEYWNGGLNTARLGFRLRRHPEQSEGSLTCPPDSNGRRGFFTEPALSQEPRFFSSLRTTGEGFRMTFLSLNLFLFPHYSNIPTFHHSLCLLEDQHGIAVTIKLVFSANGFLICLH